MKNLIKKMTVIVLVLVNSALGKAVFKVPKGYSEKSDPWYKKSKSWSLFNFESQLTNFDRNKLIIFSILNFFKIIN